MPIIEPSWEYAMAVMLFPKPKEEDSRRSIVAEAEMRKLAKTTLRHRRSQDSSVLFNYLLTWGYAQHERKLYEAGEFETQILRDDDIKRRSRHGRYAGEVLVRMLANDESITKAARSLCTLRDNGLGQTVKAMPVSYRQLISDFKTFRNICHVWAARIAMLRTPGGEKWDLAEFMGVSEFIRLRAQSILIAPKGAAAHPLIDPNTAWYFRGIAPIETSLVSL